MRGDGKIVHDMDVTRLTFHKDPASPILEESELWCGGIQKKIVTCLITKTTGETCRAITTTRQMGQTKMHDI